MNVTEQTPRNERTISGFKVSIPAPYAAGTHTLTEGEASALNQTIAENISNNLRQRLVDGVTEGEGDSATNRAYTEDEAQRVVDLYIADYEVGVRRAGSGEPRVTDPVEREARKIARAKAVELVKGAGGKPADYDMAPIIESIFEKNKDLLMTEGRKIVKANEAARAKSDGLDLTGISLAASGDNDTDEAGDEEQAA